MRAQFNISILKLDAGARIGICGLPGISGDLDADIQTVLSWKPDIVVSMTEYSEMSDYNITDLGKILGSNDIQWLHIPIRDFGGLTGANALGWPSISKRFHGLLDNGKSILLHCRGGQGRSGMIAMRLLVERGEQPKTALANLRAVRPGAVESEQQMIWASNL